MLIRVVYKDNVHDYVKDSQLDRYLDLGRIIKFQRRSGWVTVGKDPVRTRKHIVYSGPERRTRTSQA